MPPSPVSRTDSRGYPFVTPTRQSLDTNQRCQTFQHGQIITIYRPDREAIAVRLLPAMLKEKVGSSHKHQPGGFPNAPSYLRNSLIMYTLPRSKLAGMDKLSERNTLTRQRGQQSYLLAKH